MIGIDYTYMESKDGTQLEEERTIRSMPILVIHDRKSEYIASHVVTSKGSNAHATKMLKSEFEFMGYRKIVCKSDQESSILVLKETSTMTWSGEMLMADSPVGEHQANGHVERAIQRVQGIVRTLRDAFESRELVRM